MWKELLNKIKESLLSVLPVSLIVVILSFTPFINLSPKEIITFCVSSVALIIGISLFNLGADIAMSPMGKRIGGGLSKSGNVKLLLCVCFFMGLLITIAEPDLSVLAAQVSAVMNGTLLIALVGVGVGLFLVLAVLKIALRQNLSSMLIFFYCVLFGFTALVIEAGNGDFLALAFDSGGVTTGPITVPFLMSLGVGISATLGDKHDRGNSFGFVAFCSVGPVIAVMILSLTINGEIPYALPDYSIDSVLGNFGASVLGVAKEVAIALGLLVAFFAVLQIFILKLPKNVLIKMSIGIGYTFFGLVIFLTAVNCGFMPIGYSIGSQLATGNPAFMTAFAFVLGFVVVLAEPAIHVLNGQVEAITDGMVTKRSMLIALCIGVGVSLALSVIRIIFGFSILYYLVPGYMISLGLSFFVPKLYTAIAFDSGGVASGPLTSGFILPFAIGVCAVFSGEASVLSNAFGLVAMVAMTPLITIQALGFRSVIAKKMRDKRAMKRILSADDEQIIDFM